MKHLFLLHDSAHDSQVWAPLCKELSRLGIGSRAVDLLGYGARRCHRKLALADWAKDIESMIGKKNVILVGSSFGGTVCLEILRRGEVKIGRTVLLSTPYNGEFMKKSWKAAIKFFLRHKTMQELLLKMETKPEFLVNPVTNQLLFNGRLFKNSSQIGRQMPFYEWLYSMDAIMENDFTGFLATYGGNILVLTGRTDFVVTPAYAEGWKGFSCADYRLLQSDHYMHLTDTKEVCTIISDWIK